MAGLTISGKIYKKHFEGSINSAKLIQGLEHFRRQIRRPFIMIWDRSRTHRSKLMKKFLAAHSEIQIEFLPAYAPEINPEAILSWKCQTRSQECSLYLEAGYSQKIGQAICCFTKAPQGPARLLSSCRTFS